MREPSRHGIRGFSRISGGRGCLLLLLALAGLGGARDVAAQISSTPLRETGRINFVSTGGSFRNSATNTCAVNGTSTTALSGIPTTVGTTLRGAYLYWGGSGALDSSVTLNGTTITASETYAQTYTGVTPSLPFFGASANVTSIVNTVRNGNYTVAGLAVNTGDPHCAVSAVASGWALIVIYENASERVRAINLYDGLDWFRGRQITLTPSGFRVPSGNIDGRIAVFTLEGDPANSEPMNNIDEALRFNGNLLDDGINVAGSDPLVQQFDGTINSQGISTSYGIDVDQYNISAYLTPGATSGTTIYSSGADLVLLMAQIVSATSDPAVDLSATVTHSGNFVSGGTGQYTLTVSNSGVAGIEREDNTVTVTDTLPAGLTFNAATGAGWTCNAVGQVVTCTHAAPLNAGASFPPITLSVNVLEAAAPTVSNPVVVSTPSFEFDPTNNTVSDSTITVDPSLATSSKTVLDVNGGEASPGDTLRYTVTLTESAGGQAVNVVLSDDIPVNTTFGGFVSIPAGATSSFSGPPNGAFNLGVLSVSGITVPASGSVTVVFDVIVANVAVGTFINNQATITNPFGPDASPSAPTVQVNPSMLPHGGTKQLYLWNNTTVPLALSRTRPSGTHAVQTIVGNNQTVMYTLTPALLTPVTLNSGNISVFLLLARTGANSTRTVQVDLENTALGVIATSATQSFSDNAVVMYTFTLNIPAGVTAPTGSAFRLIIHNNSNNSAARTVTVTPFSGTNYSRVELNSATVINVNSVQTWNAAWNGGAQQGTFNPGNNVFVRATVSDPFGSFDISSASISIINPAGATLINGQPMVSQGVPAGCASTTSATCVFQYQYAVPASPVMGGWTIRVTANEGVEGVNDLGVGSFVVGPPMPSLTTLKSSVVLSAPMIGAPKRIPSAIVRYDITVTNSGPGAVDANSLVITDPVPPNSALYVATTSGNPVVFVNGATPSGLTYNYATNVSYSSIGVAGPWNHTPLPDANGFDAAVRAVRIVPGGAMNAAGTGNPSFTIQFRVRIN